MIRDVFSKCKRAFIPYITGGYPDPECSAALGREIARRGADIIELGVPFSDSLADGPVIQGSFTEALGRGVNPETCCRIAAEIKEDTPVPVVLMVSYNLVFRKGVEAFAAMCASYGVDGVIVPDLPPEAADKEHAVFRSRGIDMIFLVAPNTPPPRRRRIFTYTSGFLYCISRMGITGVRENLAEGLEEYLGNLRRETDLPLCVGFGISTPAHVREVCRTADGAVTGSAIVKMMVRMKDDPEEMISRVGDYVAEMKEAAESAAGEDAA